MQIAELVHKVGKGIVNFLILGGFFQVIFYNFFVCPGLGQRRRRKEVEKDKEARSFFFSLLRLVHQSRHHLKRSKKKSRWVHFSGARANSLRIFRENTTCTAFLTRLLLR